VIPEDEWLCATCQAGLQDEELPICELCPIRGGAMKRTEWGGWAHVTCALWCPATYMRSKELMEPVARLGREFSEERLCLACAICGEAKGGCVQCWMHNCFKVFRQYCFLHADCSRHSTLSARVRKDGY